MRGSLNSPSATTPQAVQKKKSAVNFEIYIVEQRAKLEKFKTNRDNIVTDYIEKKNLVITPELVQKSIPFAYRYYLNTE